MKRQNIWLLVGWKHFSKTLRAEQVWGLRAPTQPLHLSHATPVQGTTQISLFQAFLPRLFCSPFPLKLNSSRCQAAVCWWHRGEHEGPQHSDHGPVYLGKYRGASRKQGLQPAQVPQGLRCAAAIPFDAYRLPQGTCPDPWALVQLSDGGTMGTRAQTPLLVKQQLILSQGII